MRDGIPGGRLLLALFVCLIGAFLSATLHAIIASLPIPAWFVSFLALLFVNFALLKTDA